MRVAPRLIQTPVHHVLHRPYVGRPHIEYQIAIGLGLLAEHPVLLQRKDPFGRVIGWGKLKVYRARDTKLNRGVGLKVLPDAFASDPDRLARF